MRAVIQRVARATVRVGDVERGKIARGLLVFLGVGREDNVEDMEWLAQKVAKLRVFEDEEGRMNRCVSDIGGEVMVISQFTLFGSLKKGARPSFNRAGEPAAAKKMYEDFVAYLSGLLGKPVPTDVFAALMHIEAHNDGPVTMVVDTKAKDF